MSAQLPDASAHALPLTGEGVPGLLIAALAAMGTALAVVSASIWLTPPPKPPKPVTIVVREKEPAPPPTIIKVPVEAPPTIIRVPVEPPPPPCFDPVTLMFATGKSVPLIETDADRAQLRADIARLSGWLGEHADAKLLIEGHADSLGTEALNLVLSFARAKTVSTLLAGNGISPGRMTVRAAGAAEAGGNIALRYRRVGVSIEGVTACKSATSATEHP